MAIERTLSIIKPNAINKNVIGEILTRFEKNNLKIIAAKMLHLSRKEAEAFYVEHAEKPFFNELISFIISGPIMVQVLEGENAISKNREIMGATNYKNAAPGTIRADYADGLNENAAHGSDCQESANLEIEFFFSEKEIFSR